MQEILIITIIIIVLTIIVFILLSRLIKMISEDSKLYYLAKLQVFDDLIEEKEKKVSEITIEDNSEEENKEEKEEKKEDVAKEQVVVSSTASSSPNYEIENLNSLLNEIENNFNYDNEKIVKLFLERASLADDTEYLMLKSIKKKIEDYGIFEIATESTERQVEIMRELKINNNRIFKEIDEDDFDINEFMKKLDSSIEKNDPYIYVYVGNKNENYDELNQFIKTVFDEDILKGIKIKYKGRVFDYSLV